MTEKAHRAANSSARVWFAQGEPSSVAAAAHNFDNKRKKPEGHNQNNNRNSLDKPTAAANRSY